MQEGSKELCVLHSLSYDNIHCSSMQLARPFSLAVKTNAGQKRANIYQQGLRISSILHCLCRQLVCVFVTQEFISLGAIGVLVTLDSIGSIVKTYAAYNAPFSSYISRNRLEFVQITKKLSEQSRNFPDNPKAVRIFKFRG